MKNNNEFKNQFKKYARPMIVRSVFQSLMYTADRLIAALFIGAAALVATTLVSPFMFLIVAISSFFISGLGAYIGLLIGRNKIKKANHASSGILVLMGILGILLTLPSILFTEEIAYFLGARGEYFTLSVDYFRIFALSFPILLLGKGLDVLILNDGSPKYSFNLNIVTTVSNLGLNFIAVAFLGLGIKGLALATVISGGIQLIGGIWYFLKKSKVLHFARPSFHIPTFLKIVYNGFSDFAMMIVEAVMVFVINIAFVKFLTPEHFEAYAMVSIIVIIFYGIYMGATMGLQPELSQMMGRGNFHKLKNLLKYSVKKTLLYGFVTYIVLIPLVKPILTLFVNDPVTIQYGFFFYITLGFATLFSNFPLQTTIFFTAINRPLESAVISVLRTMILIPPIVYLLIIGIGPGGVALGFIIADVLIMVALYFYMKRVDFSKLKVLD
jgi:Na+-driven multidrug efflux pump